MLILPEYDLRSTVDPVADSAPLTISDGYYENEGEHEEEEVVNYYADNYGTGELDSVYVDGEYENEGEELDSAYV